MSSVPGRFTGEESRHTRPVTDAAAAHPHRSRAAAAGNVPRAAAAGNVPRAAAAGNVPRLAAAGDAPDPVELRRLLLDTFVWHDPGPASSHLVSDLSGWWRHPRILAGIGPALADLASADLADADRPSTVMTPQVTGLLVGPLVATALGVGVVPAYKEDPQRAFADATTWATTAPDYRGRTLRLGVRDRHLGPGDRVLLVDDWVTSGAQLRAMAQLAAARGAVVVGSAVIVADCPPPVVDELRIRSLIHSKDL